jgi:hypothetical protein
LPDKPVFLTRHARNKVRRWNVEPDDIEATLDHPEYQEPTIENRVNYWRAWRGMWLRVTAKDTPQQIVVISITPRRKVP